MLTATTLPSQRKISVKDNLSIDVIVPNVLNRNPDKSIIVQFLSGSLDLKKILQLELLQPNYKNIWLIYASKPLPSKKYTMYSILPDTSLHKSYSNINTRYHQFSKRKRRQKPSIYSLSYNLEPISVHDVHQSRNSWIFQADSVFDVLLFDGLWIV
jgi:hypothetical protein